MLQGLVKYTLKPKPPVIEQLDPRPFGASPEPIYA
jgi:hypothetical protein